MKRLIGIAVACGCLSASPAQASYIVARNATNVDLRTDRFGHAVVSYTADGRERHMLAWGAIDARPPSETVPRIEFRRDYSGGWKALATPRSGGGSGPACPTKGRRWRCS